LTRCSPGRSGRTGGRGAGRDPRAGTQVHGAFDGSILRDEGYHFARAGTFIERADSTARILDMKYFLLLPSLSYVGSSLDTGQWEQVLRSVAGARVYRWLNAGQIEARGIVEFVVLDDRFPRSLPSAAMPCANACRAGPDPWGRRAGARADARCRQRISHLTVDEIFEQGLHEFLVDFLARNAAIARRLPRITGSSHEQACASRSATPPTMPLPSRCPRAAAAAADAQGNAGPEDHRLVDDLRQCARRAVL
jgi:hypothetical protein